MKENSASVHAPVPVDVPRLPLEREARRHPSIEGWRGQGQACVAFIPEHQSRDAQLQVGSPCVTTTLNQSDTCPRATTWSAPRRGRGPRPGVQEPQTRPAALVQASHPERPAPVRRKVPAGSARSHAVPTRGAARGPVEPGCFVVFRLAFGRCDAATRSRNRSAAQLPRRDGRPDRQEPRPDRGDRDRGDRDRLPPTRRGPPRAAFPAATRMRWPARRRGESTRKPGSRRPSARPGISQGEQRSRDRAHEHKTSRPAAQPDRPPSNREAAQGR